MEEDSVPNLSFLHVAMDTGYIATDDKTDSDNGSATEEEDINVTLARALADVPFSADGRTPESQK